MGIKPIDTGKQLEERSESQYPFKVFGTVNGQISGKKNKIDFKDAEKIVNDYILEAHVKDPLKKIFIHVVAIYELELKLLKEELYAKTN